MSLGPVDELWFRANPDRAWRLRRATPAEAAGLGAWTIVRRETGARETFEQHSGEAMNPPDEDGPLAELFTIMQGVWSLSEEGHER